MGDSNCSNEGLSELIRSGQTRRSGRLGKLHIFRSVFAPEYCGKAGKSGQNQKSLVKFI